MSLFQHSRIMRPAAVLGLVALAAGALSSCSAPATVAPVETLDTSAPVTFTLAIQTQEPSKPLSAAIEKFKSAHPNVTVNLTEYPADQYPKSLATQLQGGNAADVFYVTGGSGVTNGTLALGRAGYLADLSGEPFAGTTPESSRALHGEDGSQWALPLGVQVVSLVVNQTAVADLGLKPATTMKELLGQCKTASNAGVALIGLGAVNPANAGLAGIVVAGSTVYAANPNWNQDRADKKTTFAGTQAWKDALQFFVDAKKDGCFQESAAVDGYEQILPAFAKGKSTQLFSPGKVVAYAAGSNPQGKFGLAPFPGATGSDTRIFASSNDGLALNAQASGQVRAAADAFLNFMSSADTDRSYAAATGQLSLADYNAGTSPKAYESVTSLLKPETTLAYAPSFWPNGGVLQALGKGIQGLLTGQATVDQVLSDMDSAYDQ